jgi:Zn-dependent protease with chaperone function
MSIVQDLRTRKEKSYQAVMMIVGALIWLAIAACVVMSFSNPKLAEIVAIYAFYAVAIAIFYWVAAAVYRASAFGNMMLLGPRQFPELYEMVASGARELGITEPPKAFLYNSNGLINAFARRLFGGRYVFLTSSLVDVTSDAQVRFVIGHELGHHAAGHLDLWKNLLKLPAHLIPFLNPAYSRAREYTCDRIGAYLSKDFAASRSSLQMLGCGCRRLNQTMTCEPFLEQEKMVPPIFGFLTEIFRSHPRLTRRVAAIKESTTIAGL